MEAVWVLKACFQVSLECGPVAGFQGVLPFDAQGCHDGASDRMWCCRSTSPGYIRTPRYQSFFPLKTWRIFILKAYPETWYMVNAWLVSFGRSIASSRCSVSQGAAQKTAHEKIKKKHGERKRENACGKT